MPPALLPRPEVIARLTEVFRQRGYDGASLSELSRATGLGRSSLYHHFPEGKDDMVRSVLDALAVELETGVFAPLRGSGDASARVRAMLRSVDAFYGGGRIPCLLAQLALGESRVRFRPAIRAIFDAWISALALALRDRELPAATARRRAEAAIVRIEGALIVGAGRADRTLFRRELRSLGRSLLAPVRDPR